MTRHDETRVSYRKLGNSADSYDGIITRSTLIGKLVDSVVWGLDRELAAKWVNDALSSVPEDFAGKLLEVPVGTGVLTMPLYRSLMDASVTNQIVATSHDTRMRQPNIKILVAQVGMSIKMTDMHIGITSLNFSECT